MNLFKNIYYFFCCKNEKISPEKMRELRHKRMEFLPKYNQLKKQELEKQKLEKQKLENN